MSSNKEIQEYYNILCNNNYPDFLSKYLEVKELQRLKGIGQFCGCDYNKLYKIKYWYSRYDHSIAVALITWHFTKDKIQTLAALFHDLGTPVFSHCIDFMLGDSINQETSEKSVSEIIKNSEDICDLLKEDNISIDDVTDLTKYPIIENKSPRLCADRLEGVLHTVLVWSGSWSLAAVKKVYQSIIILTNEDNKPEIGFKSIRSGENFFKAVYEYSMMLQCDENKFTMQYTADVIKILISKGLIIKEDLYKLSETEIVNLLKQNIITWSNYANSLKIKKVNKEPKNKYCVSVESKKRIVIPLCNIKNKSIRLDKVSTKVKELLSIYSGFKDKKYCYMANIREIN